MPTPLPDRLHVLLIGGGGREHAMAWSLRRSPRVVRLSTTHPENPGIASLADPVGVPFDVKDTFRLERYCDREGVNLIVIGPEAPLAAGLADRLARPGRAVLGPGAEGARLEASKSWAKRLMRSASIPTAEAHVFTRADDAKRFLASRTSPYVIKASGLCAGKGVILPDSLDEALEAVDDIMVRRAFGDAGAEVVVEERLKGPEASVLALVDGRTVAVLDPCRDHKRIGEGDTGPNTGGMGAICPAPVGAPGDLERIEREVLIPAVDALRREGVQYRGVLYAGLILTHAGPKVLEFNCRFGDPECQALLVRLESDLAELLYRTATGTLDEMDIAFSTSVSCCVVLASEGYPGDSMKGQPIEGLDEAAAMEGVQVFHANTRRDKAGGIVCNGGRTLNVVALGATLDEARERANAAAEAIRFEGKVWRRDIGAGVHAAPIAR